METKGEKLKVSEFRDLGTVSCKNVCMIREIRDRILQDRRSVVEYGSIVENEEYEDCIP